MPVLNLYDIHNKKKHTQYNRFKTMKLLNTFNTRFLYCSMGSKDKPTFNDLQYRNNSYRTHLPYLAVFTQRHGLVITKLFSVQRLHLYY